MNEARFDSIVQSLTDNWEFELLVDFYKRYALSNHKHLEFCVLLADLGLLENLHSFITSFGLHNLKDLANDPTTAPLKNGNIKALLNVYATEILPCFDKNLASDGTDELMKLALNEDITILENHISKNTDNIFQNEQNSKSLMYLTFALNQILLKTSEAKIITIVLNKFNNLNKISAIRKAYITKLVTTRVITCEKTIAFPQVGYNALHRLLGIISGQKIRYSGAARAYALVSDVVRNQLKKPTITKNLGWDTKPRVAVCISGVYRSGNLAIESTYKNIIEPLEADVFFHSWTMMQHWPGLGGSGDDWILRAFNRQIWSKCPPTLRSKKFFKSKFPQTFAQLDTPSQSIFNRGKLPAEVKPAKLLLENSETVFQESGIDSSKYLSLESLNQAKMFYGIYKAHELAIEHEKEKGFRYDYIVRCRPDVLHSNQLSFPMLDSLKANEVAMDFSTEYGPQDQFWYAQRASALAMASLWAASLDSGSLSPFPKLPQMRAHNLVLGWMTSNSLQPTHTSIKRNLNMVNSQASLSDFSTALAEDFSKEAEEFSKDRQTLEFFEALKMFNKN